MELADDVSEVLRNINPSEPVAAKGKKKKSTVAAEVLALQTSFWLMDSNCRTNRKARSKATGFANRLTRVFLCTKPGLKVRIVTC